MSLVSEHMKAKIILDKVLSGEIKSYDEVVEKMGNDDFYKLWSKNVWDLHTTEAPSVDLKTRQPSKIPHKKEWKILCSNEEVYIVKCYTFQEAIEIVKNYLCDDGNLAYNYTQLNDSFKHKEIKLKV